jgi:hypothetical protein
LYNPLDGKEDYLKYASIENPWAHPLFFYVERSQISMLTKVEHHPNMTITILK